MACRRCVILVLALLAVAGGCAKRQGAATNVPADATTPQASSRSNTGDPGLEVVVWSTDADEAVFARALAPYVAAGAAPGGLSPESEAFLASHGFRILPVPVAQLETLRVALGAPPRSVSQWLGQAIVWTEAVAGPDQPRGQSIALESERLRLGPGRLRLLARSWISPAPAMTGASAGVMTIELLPQHDEEGRASAHTQLLAPASIEATDEGQLFTRLLTRLKVRSSDTAFVLVGLPPGTDINRLAQSVPETTGLRAITDGEAGGAPSVGQVVRQPPPAAASSPNVAYETGGSESDLQGGPAGPIGPAAARLPTIGEALLSPHVWVAPRRPNGRPDPNADTRPVQTTPRRVVVALVPRLPERVRLLP